MCCEVVLDVGRGQWGVRLQSGRFRALFFDLFFLRLCVCVSFVSFLVCSVCSYASFFCICGFASRARGCPTGRRPGTLDAPAARAPSLAEPFCPPISLGRQRRQQRWPQQKSLRGLTRTGALHWNGRWQTALLAWRTWERHGGGGPWAGVAAVVGLAEVSGQRRDISNCDRSSAAPWCRRQMGMYPTHRRGAWDRTEPCFLCFWSCARVERSVPVTVVACVSLPGGHFGPFARQYSVHIVLVLPILLH